MDIFEPFLSLKTCNVAPPSYRQAQATVLDALPKLQRLQIPTKRPEDYFAEMAKTDQHMQKVRSSLTYFCEQPPPYIYWASALCVQIMSRQSL